MIKYRRGSHALARLTCHEGVAKYRYKVLQDEIKHRCRVLLLQDCETLEIEVLRGLVNNDHIHIEYSAKHYNERSSRLLYGEFPYSKKRYWGQYLWATGH